MTVYMNSSDNDPIYNNAGGNHKAIQSWPLPLRNFRTNKVNPSKWKPRTQMQVKQLSKQWDATCKHIAHVIHANGKKILAQQLLYKNYVSQKTVTWNPRTQLLSIVSIWQNVSISSVKIIRVSCRNKCFFIAFFLFHQQKFPFEDKRFKDVAIFPYFWVHYISILWKLSNRGNRNRVWGKLLGHNFTTHYVIYPWIYISIYPLCHISIMSYIHATAKAIQKTSQVTEELHVTHSIFFHTYSDELFETEQILQFWFGHQMYFPGPDKPLKESA